MRGQNHIPRTSYWLRFGHSSQYIADREEHVLTEPRCTKLEERTHSIALAQCTGILGQLTSRFSPQTPIFGFSKNHLLTALNLWEPFPQKSLFVLQSWWRLQICSHFHHFHCLKYPLGTVIKVVRLNKCWFQLHWKKIYCGLHVQTLEENVTLYSNIFNTELLSTHKSVENFLIKIIYIKLILI